MAIKCYPCIRGCAYAKIALGVVLISLAVFMLAETPLVLDCGQTRSKCPQQFGELLDGIDGVVGGHIAKQAAVNDYCDCLIECINYMTVYHSDGLNPDSTNCFRRSQAAGPKSSVVAGKLNGEDYSILPTISSQVCYSCAEASTTQDGLFMGLVVVAAVCGLMLFVSAGCEHLEVKHHNISYTFCSIASDVVCTLALVMAFCLSVKGGEIADIACSPSDYTRYFEKAGLDSTTKNSDEAALFVEFFMNVFNPGMQQLCAEHKTLHVFCYVTVLATLSSAWSFVATACTCLGISDDGEDSDDSHPDHHHALELQDLLKMRDGRFRGHLQ